jgi:hypothetical protein
MTDCTGRHPIARPHDLPGEGQKDTAQEAQR